MKTQFISTIVILVIFSFVGVQSTDVRRCTDNNATLPEVDIKDCDKGPCIFYINATGVMTMKFRAPRYLEHIAPKAQAILGGLVIDYQLDETDACDGITNTPCPLAKGEYIEYTFGMFILPLFPAISLVLEFSLIDLDQNNEPFECFNADLKLEAQT